MPEFILDTSGKAYVPISETTLEARRWADLDAFTQGYIEAMFFTNEEEEELSDKGFSDLAPEALAAIIAECAKFQADQAVNLTAAYERDYEEEQAGRDFWYTRNGHGVGYWDREELKPDGAEYDLLTLEMVANRDDNAKWGAALAKRNAIEANGLGALLSAAAEAAGEVDVYLGDDGKVYHG